MKIVLIAGFSNQEIREHLQFRNDQKWYHWLIKLFRLPARVGEFRDYASWVVSMISDLEKRDDIELHVVGHQIRLEQSMQTFQLRGVTYHFYQSEWTSLMRKCNSYRLWRRLQRSTHYVQQVVDEVKPDLIVLSGAENPATSIGILASDKCPRLCLCQTIYNDMYNGVPLKRNPLIQEMELDILKQMEYVGVYCRKHYERLKALGYQGHILKYNYPSKGKYSEPPLTKKEYDFVNFALNHSSMKGTHDSIKALAIVKQKYPDVTLNIVGGCRENVRHELDLLITQLDLKNNVVFTPFFEKRRDLFLHVLKSRFAVLPCKLDNTSGTMSQSMVLRIPIVVYKTPGTQAYNKDRRCALVAEMDDVNDLARYMLELMDNPALAEELSTNGRWYKEHKAQMDNDNWNRIVDSFKYIVESSKGGSPLPQKFLFDPERDY